MTGLQDSNGGIMLMAEKKKSWHCPPWSLSGVFCFMCCRKGLWRSGITGCSETGIKRRNWRFVRDWPTHRSGQRKSFRLDRWFRNWLATTSPHVLCAVLCFDSSQVSHHRLCPNRIHSSSIARWGGGSYVHYTWILLPVTAKSDTLVIRLAAFVLISGYCDFYFSHTWSRRRFSPLVV